MKSDYNDRRARRRERYEDRIESSKQESEAASDAAHRAIEHIPPGQPILVGHHSERRHRRDLARHDSAMRRSIDASKKADHYRGKLSGMDYSGISSDDPEAITQLKAKLAAMETTHAAIKARPHETWELSNSSANIRRVKQRIEELEKKETLKDFDQEYEGLTVEHRPSENRLFLDFDTKPPDDVLKLCKSHGFRWARSIGRWSAYYNSSSIYWAKEIAKQYPPKEQTNETTNTGA